MLVTHEHLAQGQTSGPENTHQEQGVRPLRSYSSVAAPKVLLKFSQNIIVDQLSVRHSSLPISSRGQTHLLKPQAIGLIDRVKLTMAFPNS